MIPPGYQVRRATIEDLSELSRLWEEADLPAADLKERFREFQVVCDSAGLFLGAVGLQIVGTQGKLHSEIFANPAHEDEYRDPLWERVMSLARNHGLVRLWTQEDAPFWHHVGFKPPTEEQRQKLPPVFGTLDEKWQVLQLKDEAAVQKAMDQEFTVFMLQQKEETTRMMQRAKTIRIAAFTLATIIALIVGGMALLVFLKRFRDRER